MPPGWDRWFATYERGLLPVPGHGRRPHQAVLYWTARLRDERSCRGGRALHRVHAGQHAAVPLLRTTRPTSRRPRRPVTSTPSRTFRRGVRRATTRRTPRTSCAHPQPVAGRRQAGRDRYVPSQAIPLAACRGPGGRGHRPSPRGVRTAREHPDPVHLGQRDGLGRTAGGSCCPTRRASTCRSSCGTTRTIRSPGTDKHLVEYRPRAHVRGACERPRTRCRRRELRPAPGQGERPVARGLPARAHAEGRGRGADVLRCPQSGTCTCAIGPARKSSMTCGEIRNSW